MAAYPQSITFGIPPWPTYLYSSFRQFEQGERHVTRIISEYVLLIMLDQTLHFTESGIDIELTAGDWYLQVPGHKQEGRMGSPAPFYYYIHFTACLLDEADPAAVMEYEPLPDSACHRLALPIRGRFELHRIKPLLQQLDVTAKQRPSDFLSQQSLFLEVLNKVSDSERMTDYPSRQKADQILNFLAAHYNHPITGKQLSEHFHYSYDYIQRLLKQHYHTTPGQYIQVYRIRRAQELLEMTDHPIPWIASEVGYNDATVFYKAFRKHTGEAPGVWRRRKRGLGAR